MSFLGGPSVRVRFPAQYSLSSQGVSSCSTSVLAGGLEPDQNSAYCITGSVFSCRLEPGKYFHHIFNNLCVKTDTSGFSLMIKKLQILQQMLVSLWQHFAMQFHRVYLTFIYQHCHWLQQNHLCQNSIYLSLITQQLILDVGITAHWPPRTIVLEGHVAGVNSVAFSHHGKWDCFRLR